MLPTLIGQLRSPRNCTRPGTKKIVNYFHDS